MWNIGVWGILGVIGRIGRWTKPTACRILTYWDPVGDFGSQLSSAFGGSGSGLGLGFGV